MKAILIRTNTVIQPFGDPVGETLILDRPLRLVQGEALRACGLEPALPDISHNIISVPGHSGPAIALHDTLYFTARLVGQFLELARALPGEGPVRLWLREGLFTRLLAVVQDGPSESGSLAMPLWYLPDGALDPDAPARRLELDVDEDSYEGHFPIHMIKKEGYRFGVTSRPVMAITHPLHLALANMAANFARLAELKKMSLAGKLLTVLRARSLSKFRILAAVSRIHPEAEVHPTAVIEGSVIEKGAKIGAYAVVRFSYVGENAFIDDHAGIKFSSVGSRSYIANNCVLFFSVVYPRAFLISGPYQFTLFGYDSAMMNAIPSDYRLDGEPIPVRTSRGLVSTGLRFVGSVIGHRSKIAAGVIIAPGRIIPNDIHILPDPARVIASVPDDLQPGSTYCLIGGRLVSAAPPNKKSKES